MQEPLETGPERKLLWSPRVHTSERVINREINNPVSGWRRVRKAKDGGGSFRKECNERARDTDHQDLR